VTVCLTRSCAAFHSTFACSRSLSAGAGAGPPAPTKPAWLETAAWERLRSLEAGVAAFEGLCADIAGTPDRWREIVEAIDPQGRQSRGHGEQEHVWRWIAQA